MIYNYRFDRSLLTTNLERLRNEGELSQGWGGGVNGDLSIIDAEFIWRCKEYYELVTTRVPSNLTRIRDFNDGDLLVVPHLPENGEVSIHVVAGDFPSCYRYEPLDDSHQNHRIKIARSYGLDGAISIRNTVLLAWYAKLQWLRLPVLPIPQHDEAFRRIVAELEKEPTHRYEQSDFTEYMESLHKDLIGQLNIKLQDVRPSGSEVSFESICESLLVSSGYRVVTRNHYDSEGGDVDLHCVRERSDASPFEIGETTLFVQVKKHAGITDESSVKQLILMIKREPTADGCVMSLGESFTNDAEELARQNGILLMSGDTICQLLLRELGSVTDA